MRKYARWLLVLAAILAAVVSVGFVALDRAARQVPEFYERALAAQPEAQKAAGQKLEQQALSLHNQVRNAGRWEARFSQDEINGWLAADMPVKFPKALPRGVSDPRMAIEEEQVQLAVRYERGSTRAVVALKGQVQLTPEPNELAIRIDSVKAGALPLPLNQFREEIAQRAATAGVPIRWTEEAGAPVALVRLPLNPKDFGGRRLIVEELRLTAGELVVAGRTEPHLDPTESEGESSHAAAPPHELKAR